MNKEKFGPRKGWRRDKRGRKVDVHLDSTCKKSFLRRNRGAGPTMLLLHRSKFFDRWQWLKRFEPRVASNTPKLHWLCCHLTEFARRRRWFALVSEQCIEHIHSHFDRLAPRYKNTGSEEKTMMKLARHQAILNSLHALDHEDEGRNSDENDPPRGRRMTQ
uniref:Uncharacterized protein n=1 Tax=Globodera rostochiensis TaxID=31243 RepID=A0A914GZA8_GLORO